MADVFPYCSSAVDFNTTAQWSQCIQQGAFYNDPILMTIFILIGFVIIMVIGRHNLSVAAMIMSGLILTFAISNPNPMWGIVIGLILIAAIWLFIRGVRKNAE